MINFALYCVKLLENTSVYSAKFALSKTKSPIRNCVAPKILFGEFSPFFSGIKGENL